MAKCIIDGCIGLSRTQGLCNRHALRRRRYGTPYGGGPAYGLRNQICSQPECKAKAKAHGLCNAHYKRLLSHGDANVLKKRMSPRGAPLSYLLEHMNDQCCYPWPFARGKNGYAYVVVDGKIKLAHRHVCEVAHGPSTPENPHALHKCGQGNAACFSASCLYWGTPADNGRDTIQHNIIRKNRRHLIG